MRDFVHASEAVTAGHPDKLCDQISDAVIDACLCESPPIGCVAECAIASGVTFLSIRHGAPLPVDPASLARRVLAECGYPEMADPGRATVILDTVATPELQAAAAARTAEPARLTTAFGYATADGPARMPLPIALAHAIAGRIGTVGTALPWLVPDAQVQVGLRYAERRPAALCAVALACHGGEGMPGTDAAGAGLRAEVVAPALAALGWDLPPGLALGLRRMPGGGGPRSHSGLTGRKTGDDTYGGFARQAGSALSGKDPSRIDRIAAYAARQAAVSVVDAGLARECEVQLSYVADSPAPVSLEIDSFGSGAVPDREIRALLERAVDLAPGAVVERLGLWSLPAARGGRFYRDVASLGQMGRPELALPWDVPLPLG